MSVEKYGDWLLLSQGNVQFFSSTKQIYKGIKPNTKHKAKQHAQNIAGGKAPKRETTQAGRWADREVIDGNFNVRMT